MNRENAAASCISEDVTETDQILDDLILGKDAEEEERNGKRDEVNVKEARLVEVGK